MNTSNETINRRNHGASSNAYLEAEFIKTINDTDFMDDKSKTNFPSTNSYYSASLKGDGNSNFSTPEASHQVRLPHARQNREGHFCSLTSPRMMICLLFFSILFLLVLSMKFYRNRETHGFENPDGKKIEERGRRKEYISIHTHAL